MSDSILTKICSKCQIEKPLAEYHKCKGNKYGVQCKCIACRKAMWTVPRAKKAKAEKKLLASQGLKKCGKCHAIKEFSYFSISSITNDGIKSTCKECIAKGYQKNRNKTLKRVAKYRKNNKKTIAITDKKYRTKNKEFISKKRKESRQKNKKALNLKAKKKASSPSKSKRFLNQLPITDNPKFNKDGEITVSCYFCKKTIIPNYGQILNRINCIKGSLKGEQNFYCSDECKQSCPTFGFQPGIQIDPRSKLYVPPTISEYVRKTQTKELKKAQCREVGYNYCEVCQDIIDVELHHTLPVKKFGLKAKNENTHILMCAMCHIKLHSECTG